MTTTNNGTTTVQGRRRMAGYTPLSTTASEPDIAPPERRTQAPSPEQTVARPDTRKIATTAPTAARGSATAQAAAAPATREATGTTVAGADAPVRKTRLGAAVAPPVQGAPAGQQRMGAGTSGGRQRMGGVVAQSAAPLGPASDADTATTPRTAADPAGSAGARRMGAPTAAQHPAGPVSSSATTSSTPAVGAGTPGPAGAGAPGTDAGRPAWVRPVLITAALVIVALAVVLGARWLRTLQGVQAFITTYDGHASQPAAAPVGIPGWLGWQHFLNMFFIVLIIRTGLQVRTERKPPGYWTAKPDSFFSPRGNTPKKVSLSQWLHQVLDVLWVANGLVFIVLLFATGHWARIVPTSWDIVPNMVSGAIQYASLDWPTEDGWVHYNALQVMAYFTTVFIAAPLAIASGVRFSTWWPERADRLSRLYPVEWARAVHFPVMLYFVAFTIVHVFLVFFTGALANLNHMYTSRDVVDGWGLVIFLASLVVIAAAWFLARPMFTTPIAARTGTVSK